MGCVCFYDRLLLSLILSLRGGVVSMVCGRDTNQKKMKHGLVFSRIHYFDFILVLVFDSVGFASAGALPFSLVNAF